MSNPLSGLATALLTALALLAFSGYQVTGETAAPRLLGRLAASLVELDRWVPAHSDDIELLARDRPDENILIDDLPVDVLVSSQSVLRASDEELAVLLRDAMGARLYTEGRDALQDEQGTSHLGVTEPVRWTVTFLTADTHSFWRLALTVTALLTLVLAGSLAMTRQSPLPLLLAGAVAASVVAFLGWLIAGGAGSLFESSVDKEIVQIARDSAWLGLRNSLALSAIVLALLYLQRAFLAPRWRDDEELYWPEASEPLDEPNPDAS